MWIIDNLFFKEEHKMIKKIVSEFVNDQIHPIAREIDEKDRIPKDIVGTMGELVLKGINIHGSYFYVLECDVDRFFRESKILTIA